SFIDKGTFMDMMYMDDAIQAIIDLMEADASKLEDRNAFNVTKMSFDPEMVAESIRRHYPEFELTYDVDPVRQGIAENWPNSFDAKFDLDKMTDTMIEAIKKKL